MVVLGGSGALFGIDAELIERKLGIPTVNYATHAGTGLDFILSRSKKILHHGDRVLLALEYEMLGDPSPIPLPMQWDYMWSYDKLGIIKMGWPAMIAIYQTPISKYEKSISNLWDILTKKEQPIASFAWPFLSRNGDIRVLKAQLKDIGLAGPVDAAHPSKVQVLREFVQWARSEGIELMATWPNGYLGEGKAVDQAAARMRYLEDLYRKLGIPVLGAIQDFSFPHALYMETCYHVSPAGRRIRTEKLIQYLRPQLRIARVGLAENALFVMPGPAMELTDGNLLRGEPGVQFKYLSESTVDHPDLITLDEIIRRQKMGIKVYYDDRNLDLRLLPAGYWGDEVSRGLVSLDSLVKQYEDHIFLLVASGTNRFNMEPPKYFPESFKRFLAGDGFRVGILGTGRYSRVERVERGRLSASLIYHRGDALGSGAKSPIEIALKSGASTAPLGETTELKIDGEVLNIQKGLTVVVLDVEAGIIVRNCTVPASGDAVSWRLNRIAPLDQIVGIQAEEIDPKNFVGTGWTAPQVKVANGVARVDFNTINGVWALKLEGNRLHRRGVLELTCQFSRPGKVSAGVITNAYISLAYMPPLVPMDTNRQEAQKIHIPFEFGSYPSSGEKEWVFAGLIAPEPGAIADVRNPRILWKD